MIYFIIGLILAFNYVVFKMSSNCSRIEEKIYIEEDFEEKN